MWAQSDGCHSTGNREVWVTHSQTKLIDHGGDNAMSWLVWSKPHVPGWHKYRGRSSAAENENTPEISKTRTRNLHALFRAKCCSGAIQQVQPTGVVQQVPHLGPKWWQLPTSALQLISSTTDRNKDIFRSVLQKLYLDFFPPLQLAVHPYGCVCRHRHCIDTTCSNRCPRLSRQMAWQDPGIPDKVSFCCGDTSHCSSANCPHLWARSWSISSHCLFTNV